MLPSTICQRLTTANTPKKFNLHLKLEQLYLAKSPKNPRKLRISQQSLTKLPTKQFSFRYAAGLQSSVV